MMRSKTTRTWALMLSLVLPALPVMHAAADDSQDVNPPAEIMNKPSPVLSPEEALKSFTVEDGFEIQLVASEPLVEDPVCMAWDADGRLWVCEMRGYMPDQTGKGEEDPNGNIVILEDTDGDGVMDKRTVFLDGIVLPRAIAFAKGGLIYADYQKLKFIKINDDLTPGRWFDIDAAYANNGGGKSNVEHQANGLLYGLDNWYYSAKSSRRYQQFGTRFRRSDTEFRGQWGITQDDDGLLLANRNPVLIERELLPPTATKRNENLPKFNAGSAILRVNPDVYPIHPTPGTNRAYRPAEVDHETWTLNRATAACGPVIYRGDQFPAEFYNNVFIPEPAGNLLKRVILSDNGKDKPSAEQAYENKEFIASTDERNRFVNAYVGPDGCLYLVDMYRGLIQHKTYITDYLRRQINARQLDKPVGYGRIYRVVHKDSPVNHAAPKLSDKPSADLVPLLGHANAWYRETAQRLLVERGDEEAVAPLEQLAQTSTNPQARIHALWTLKGMGALKPMVLLSAGNFDNQRVRIHVMRLAEDFEGTPEAKVFVSLMRGYAKDASWEMDMQLALSAGRLASLDNPEAYDILLGVLERRTIPTGDKSRDQDNALFRHAVISGLEGKEAVMLAKISEAKLEKTGIEKDLTGAVVAAVNNGTLTIGSLLKLIDSPEFTDQRQALLGNLASQSVEQGRDDVILLLIDRMAKPDASPDDQRIILQGMIDGRSMRTNTAELDGKPELFAQWQQSPPEPLADLVAQLNDVFAWQKTQVSAEDMARIENGKMLYAAQCSSCHNADGSGLPQNAPPLIGSEWVNYHPKMLAALVLNGVKGDIRVNGKLYKEKVDTPGFMPALKNAEELTDADFADILTYIRSREMGNTSGPVDPAIVTEMRKAYASQTDGFTASQLFEMHVRFSAEDGVAVELPKREIVKVAWLDHSKQNLVFTLVAVTLPLGLLLLATLFGGGKIEE